MISWILSQFNYIVIIIYNQTLKCLKQFSIKNILSLNALAKILFLYAAVVLNIIVFYFDFSIKKYDNNKPFLAIYSISNRIGEKEAYIRTLKALKKLNWQYVGCKYNEYFINYKLTRHFYESAAYIISYILKPKVNITLTHYVKIIPPGYNLIYLNVPDNMLYSLEKTFLPQYPHLENYDGYIDLYSVYNKENKVLKDILDNYGKNNAPIIPAYLAQDEMAYIEPNNYDKLVITGSLWGCNRGSFRMRNAILKLGNDKQLIAYGLDWDLKFLGDAYKGRAEKYGIPGEVLITLQRDAGMALAVHNLEHLVEGLPTSRFAEAVIAGAVLISDKHPFLQKFFGDNILYFDSLKSSEEIYNEIANHIIWVKSHPKEATIKARRAYEIFVKNWTIEVQLKKIMQYLEEIHAI